MRGRRAGPRQEPPRQPPPAHPVDRHEVFIVSYRALGLAVLRHAVEHDPGWFRREAGAVRFWSDLVGVHPDAVQEALRR